MDEFFPHNGPMATEQSERLRAYVLLTILHDKELQGSACRCIAEGIWPLDAEFVKTQWNKMTSDSACPMQGCGWALWRDEIDAALGLVEADLESQKRKIAFIKAIPVVVIKVVSGIVVFLASLLTIFYFLGWL